MASKRKQTAPARAPAPAASEPIVAVDPVLEELRAIKSLLAVIAAATTRTALTGDVNAPDPHGLIEQLRAASPYLAAALVHSNKAQR